MRSIGSCLVVLALLAVPGLAQSPPAPACGANASFPVEGLEGLLQQPLTPEQRLFLGMTGLEQKAPLEIRYLVNRKPYLTEVVDLATSRLPQVDTEKSESLNLATALGEERMFELLALRPDLVRQLHQLANKNGGSIQIELHQEGRLVESLSFQKLKRRSADLAARRAVPLVVKSKVRGPGEGGSIRSVTAFDYLESCGDCTTSTPCDTECGWDPGKGGPVTCGEYGVCEDNSTCACSTVYQEFWTGWYVYNAYYSNQYACYHSSSSGSTWHQLYVQQIRRDRIRRTFVCPNCPACTGCYTQEDVIDYQLSSTGCWSNTYSPCFYGDTPYCSSLCSFSWHCT